MENESKTTSYPLEWLSSEWKIWTTFENTELLRPLYVIGRNDTDTFKTTLAVS